MLPRLATSRFVSAGINCCLRTSIFSICCAMEDNNPSCDEVEVSHRQSTAKGYYTRSKAKQAIGEASSNQPAETILEEDYSEKFKSVSHQSPEECKVGSGSESELERNKSSSDTDQDAARRGLLLSICEV